jgi:hypothetical protein
MRRALGLVAAALLLVAVTAPAAQADSIAHGMGWSASLYYPAGTFKDGSTYRYWTKFSSASCGCPDYYPPDNPITFRVDKDTPIFPGIVQLRYWGIVANTDIEGLPEALLNPDQPVKYVVFWSWDPSYETLSQFRADRADTLAYISFVGPDGPWTLASNGPIKNGAAIWGPYQSLHDTWHSTSFWCKRK